MPAEPSPERYAHETLKLLSAVPDLFRVHEMRRVSDQQVVWVILMRYIVPEIDNTIWLPIAEILPPAPLDNAKRYNLIEKP